MILAAAALRSFTTGLVAVVLGLYLAALGAPPQTLGLVVALGLASNAAATAGVAVAAERLGRRRALLTASVLSAAGLAAFALVSAPVALGLAAFAGMLNGMGRDRGAAQTLDQAILADVTPDARRTPVFARYTLVQDLAATIGSLTAATAGLLQRVAGVAPAASYRWLFLLAAAAALAQAVLYARLAGAGAQPATRATSRLTISAAARRRVAELSGLFALDSLGGGFLAGSILSYWFFRRFGLGPEALGGLFFAAHLLNALSYLGAEAIARRVGLVRTMVFTHLPSSALLLALPFVDRAWIAVALFLARESLVQMDVPTRQSYVAAVVAPGERTFALGMTGLARNVGWALGPALAGLAMATFGLGAPLVAGGGLKVVYDVALYLSYRGVRAPEERGAATGA